MKYINLFDKFLENYNIINEGYLDNIDVDITWELKKHKKKYRQGYLYKFTIDGGEFNVFFYTIGTNKYEMEYYYISSDKHQFAQNLGIDPRKVIITVVKVIIDFLEKIKPYSVYFHNIDMQNERPYRINGKIGQNKRNKITFYYLEKMIPNKWKLYRTDREILILPNSHPYNEWKKMMKYGDKK